MKKCPCILMCPNFLEKQLLDINLAKLFIIQFPIFILVHHHHDHLHHHFGAKVSLVNVIRYLHELNYKSAGCLKALLEVE